MKKIACFSIPAHGHTNPMLPVAAELVRRGNAVRFYSFDVFAEKIRATGAEFISCDALLPKLTAREEAGLKRVSATEMTVQDIHATLAMDNFLNGEFKSFQPDVVFTDSVCFWGKLNAWKHGVPMVVSTSTFAFNQLSSQYMKSSPREMADMMLGLPRIARELKQLEPLGYPAKGPLALIQSDNATDSVVYATRTFQPFAESFSDHYLFAGPSVSSDASPDKHKPRPLVYISLGTILNDRPDFYRRCIEALRGLEVDAVISCGEALRPEALGALPENIRAYPRVNQLEVLSRADAFITHCGMNSVSESMYMATPMVLYPQTGEQHAVARRAAELGAGLLLKDDSAPGIRAAVQKLLDDPAYAQAAARCSADFRAAPGPAGAAGFIETVPHTSNGVDPLRELNRASGLFQLVYWLVAIAAIYLTGHLAGWPFSLSLGLAAGLLSSPAAKTFQKKKYAAQVRKARLDNVGQ